MNSSAQTPNPFFKDITAGFVVFLVALPLCLGVALASGAPLISGIISGIVGGIVVGIVSQSATSVSGPAAGLTAVVASQITSLGSFSNFLAALVIAGLFQIGFGLFKAGFLGDFIPNSVIKGLLAAIGIILILKQIPHLFGLDGDPEGDFAFLQPDNRNTLSELADIFIGSVMIGPAIIGLSSIFLMLGFERFAKRHHTAIPAPLVVVVFGTLASYLGIKFIGSDFIAEGHRVAVPLAKDALGYLNFLSFPSLPAFFEPSIYLAGFTIALIASIETLLNLNAVDRIDPQKRTSSPNRELFAQGCGNLVAGLIGGIPVTSVIVRSSVNVSAKNASRNSTIFHGLFLMLAVLVLPNLLNMMPLSCLAAILLLVGAKLASPQIFVSMWQAGWMQFIPFVTTVLAIVFTDLLIGVLLGLAISIVFILGHNIRRPLRPSIEKRVSGKVHRLSLSSQVSFLNKAALIRSLNQIPHGSNLVIDGNQNDFMDCDISATIKEFCEETALIRKINVSLKGLKNNFSLVEANSNFDLSTKKNQEDLSPDQVLSLLLEGNRRFRKGKSISRDHGSVLLESSESQHPVAVVLSCIDSRTPVETIFDQGLGDIFSVRIAGNVVSQKVFGSIEYSCTVAGACLILVMGHSRCGAVAAGVKSSLTSLHQEPEGCKHVGRILADIRESCDAEKIAREIDSQHNLLAGDFTESVGRRNVLRSLHLIRQNSPGLLKAEKEGKIKMVGAFYHLDSGSVEILSSESLESQALNLLKTSRRHQRTLSLPHQELKSS